MGGGAGQTVSAAVAHLRSVLSDAFHLLGAPGALRLLELLRRGAVLTAFELSPNLDAVLRLLQKYVDVPVGLADAALVRMTDVFDDPTLLTTDTDFRVYRRHGRQVMPIVAPRRQLMAAGPVASRRLTVALCGSRM